MNDWFEFELLQNGLVVAETGSSNRENAFRDIMHYAAVYSQDGPVIVHEITPAPREPARRETP